MQPAAPFLPHRKNQQAAPSPSRYLLLSLSDSFFLSQEQQPQLPKAQPLFAQTGQGKTPIPKPSPPLEPRRRSWSCRPRGGDAAREATTSPSRSAARRRGGAPCRRRTASRHHRASSPLCARPSCRCPAGAAPPPCLALNTDEPSRRTYPKPCSASSRPHLIAPADAGAGRSCPPLRTPSPPRKGSTASMPAPTTPMLPLFCFICTTVFRSSPSSQLEEFSELRRRARRSSTATETTTTTCTQIFPTGRTRLLRRRDPLVGS